VQKPDYSKSKKKKKKKKESFFFLFYERRSSRRKPPENIESFIPQWNRYDVLERIKFSFRVKGGGRG